jgi:hypothetical protein
VSDQDDPVQPEVVHHGNDILAKRRDGELLSVLSGFPVPREVGTDNAVTRGQMIGLPVPDVAVTAPTVHEDQRRFPVPTQVVVD